MAMREGTGMTTAPVTPAVAFAFLADPRNAPEWFAPVTFVQHEPGDAPSHPTQRAQSAGPTTPATRVDPSASVTRVGATWRFIPNAPASQATQSATRRRAAIPMRMAAYEPPVRFVWETTYGATRDNLRWEVTCAPTPTANDSTEAAVTGATDGAAQITGRDAGSDTSPPPTSLHTAIHLTLRIQPGPLGWVSLVIAAPFTRGGLDRRAQRALDRARETLAARAELAAQPPPPRGHERRAHTRGRRR